MNENRKILNFFRAQNVLEQEDKYPEQPEQRTEQETEQSEQQTEQQIQEQEPTVGPVTQPMPALTRQTEELEEKSEIPPFDPPRLNTTD